MALLHEDTFYLRRAGLEIIVIMESNCYYDFRGSMHAIVSTLSIAPTYMGCSISKVPGANRVKETDVCRRPAGSDSPRDSHTRCAVQQPATRIASRHSHGSRLTANRNSGQGRSHEPSTPRTLSSTGTWMVSLCNSFGSPETTRRTSRDAMVSLCFATSRVTANSCCHYKEEIR